MEEKRKLPGEKAREKSCYRRRMEPSVLAFSFFSAPVHSRDESGSRTDRLPNQEVLEFHQLQLSADWLLICAVNSGRIDHGSEGAKRQNL
jgi:hypothetical protein